MKKVVIVDDTMFMRMTLKNIMENLGLKVVGEGANGDQAVTLFKRLKPDLITMDITMPQKDGLEAVREIIELDSEATIIMVSAMGQKFKVIDAMSAGAKDFIVKPFQLDRVEKSLIKIGIIEGESADEEGSAETEKSEDSVKQEKDL